MKHLPWGHESRHCMRCGKVGPRIQRGWMWMHHYCLTPKEKSERRKEQKKARAH